MDADCERLSDRVEAYDSVIVRVKAHGRQITTIEVPAHAATVVAKNHSIA